MHPDGGEHARVRKHMMKFFNADNVAKTIEELSVEARRTAAAIGAAEAGAAAYAGDPDNRRVRIDDDGAPPPPPRTVRACMPLLLHSRYSVPVSDLMSKVGPLAAMGYRTWRNCLGRCQVVGMRAGLYIAVGGRAM